MEKQINETNWAAVGARALAYQAMHLAGLSDAGVLAKAHFLMVLGLPRSEAAGLIGSTDESLRKGFEREAKKAGSAKGKGKVSSGE
jgi:hypothetical protein